MQRPGRRRLQRRAGIPLLRVVVGQLRREAVLIVANWRWPVAGHALSSIRRSWLEGLRGHRLRAARWWLSTENVGKGGIALAGVGGIAVAIALPVLSSLLRAVVRHLDQDGAPGAVGRGARHPRRWEHLCVQQRTCRRVAAGSGVERVVGVLEVGVWAVVRFVISVWPAMGSSNRKAVRKREQVG
jgi:hypothetical protein